MRIRFDLLQDSTAITYIFADWIDIPLESGPDFGGNRGYKLDLPCYVLYPILVHKGCTKYKDYLEMKQVTISEFRANLLKYLKVVQRGEQMNITSKGRMLATLIPPVSQHIVSREKLAKLAKTAVIHDVVTPTEDSWSAMK